MLADLRSFKPRKLCFQPTNMYISAKYGELSSTNGDLSKNDVNIEESI